MSAQKLPIYMKPEDWAEAYGSEIPHWAENLEPSPLARKFLHILKKDSGNKILEIGIGNGRDSIYFATKGNRVSGIDVVRNAVEMAKRNASAADVAGVDFMEGNAEKLEFDNESFDGVYSVSVLHATDLKLSLKELSRVLRPRGKALIYLYEKTFEDGKEYWFMKREEIEEILEEVGLKIENRREILHKGDNEETTTVLIYKLVKK